MKKKKKKKVTSDNYARIAWRPPAHADVQAILLFRHASIVQHCTTRQTEYLLKKTLKG